MMTFIHSKSKMTIYTVSSGNKLDGITSYTTAWTYLIKKVLTLLMM